MMKFSEYQQQCAEFAVYPKEREREYLTLGLWSEVGELAGKLKKEIRDGVDLTEDILDECGDVLWYAGQIGRYGGYIPSDIVSDYMRLDYSDLLCMQKIYYNATECGMTYSGLYDVIRSIGFLAINRGSTLLAVMERNLAKLRSRKERNQLHGSGDKR